MAKIQSFKLRELKKNNSKAKSRIKKFKVNAAKSFFDKHRQTDIK